MKSFYIVTLTFKTDGLSLNNISINSIEYLPGFDRNIKLVAYNQLRMIRCFYKDDAIVAFTVIDV